MLKPNLLIDSLWLSNMVVCTSTCVVCRWLGKHPYYGLLKQVCSPNTPLMHVRMHCHGTFSQLQDAGSVCHDLFRSDAKNTPEPCQTNNKKSHAPQIVVKEGLARGHGAAVVITAW